MSKIVHVVDGEASESESEIELGKSPDEYLSRAEAFIIPGEAPESDDESKISSPAPQAAPAVAEAPTQVHPMRHHYTSLLHQKLWECNVSLGATVEGLLHHSAHGAADRLARADRALLAAQESMRTTNANLSVARARLKQVRAALERANCGAAFTSVKI